MMIAVLAWGSLIWDSRELGTDGNWQAGSPVAPVEFSRVSSDGRLTLVVDEKNGVDTATLFAKSAFGDLREAIDNLQSREGMPTNKNIGAVVCGRPVLSFPKASVMLDWTKALEYFEKAPAQVRTPLRSAVEERFAV